MARTKKYKDELEAEIIALLRLGKTTREVAHIMTVRGKPSSKSAVARILKMMKDKGLKW